MSEQPVVSVAVMGQGYVGLPLAMRAAQVGYCVTGFEPDPARLARLIEGDSYIEDVGDSVLRDQLAAGRYRPTADVAALAGFDVAVIAVPTPL